MNLGSKSVIQYEYDRRQGIKSGDSKQDPDTSREKEREPAKSSEEIRLNAFENSWIAVYLDLKEGLDRRSLDAFPRTAMKMLSNGCGLPVRFSLLQTAMISLKRSYAAEWQIYHSISSAVA